MLPFLDFSPGHRPGQWPAVRGSLMPSAPAEGAGGETAPSQQFFINTS